MLRIRHRAYVAFAATSLALAVGATLTVFTVVNALWLKPLPFPEPDRLVTFVAQAGDSDSSYSGVETEPVWTVFDAVAGQVPTSGRLGGLKPHLVIDEVGREVEMLAVTSKYFGLFRQPIRGRDFTPDDSLFGAEPVAIISDRLWMRQFDRRPEIIGAVVAAKPFPIRIIGVAPEGFSGARRGEATDLWLPVGLIQRLAPGGAPLEANDVPTILFARLRPGQTVAEARLLLIRGSAHPMIRRHFEGVHIVPLDEVFGTPESRSIVIREHGATTVVAGLAGLVLVAGCVTLMALVLVHYERRRRELAIRTALGASRGALTRELSTELVWIALLGGTAALLMSFWSLRALPSLSLPGGVDLGRLNLSIDSRVVLACLSTTALTLMAAAVVPIRRFTRADVATELVAPGATSPRSSQRLREGLLTIHVAATIVVLIAAGLFVRAVIFGFGAGPGFDVNRTVFIDAEVVRAFSSAGETPEKRLSLASERTAVLRQGLMSLPGVEQIAIGWAPIGAEPAASMLAPKQVETRAERRELKVGMVTAGPELLSALGVPILKGLHASTLRPAARSWLAIWADNGLPPGSSPALDSWRCC